MFCFRQQNLPSDIFLLFVNKTYLGESILSNFFFAYGIASDTTFFCANYDNVDEIVLFKSGGVFVHFHPRIFLRGSSIQDGSHQIIFGKVKQFSGSKKTFWKKNKSEKNICLKFKKSHEKAKRPILRNGENFFFPLICLDFR
jgi:hypothetical protein